MATQITKIKVSRKQRLNTLPVLFGNKCIMFEQMVYSYMDKFCSDYHGGFWEFYFLSNGGFFMSLLHGEKLLVSFPENYFEEIMSPEAISIGVNLYALNELAWKTEKESIIDLYYALRDFASQHEEGAFIMRLID